MYRSIIVVCIAVMLSISCYALNNDDIARDIKALPQADTNLRQGILLYLASTGDDRVIPSLISALNEKDEDNVEIAYRGLISQHSDNVFDVFAKLAKSNNDNDKAMAIDFLSISGDSRAVPILIDIYNNNHSEKLRLRLISLLASTQDIRVIPILEKNLGSINDDIRKRTIAGLIKLRNSKIIDIFQKTFGQADVDLRLQAVVGMDDINSKSFIPILKMAVKDNNAKVRKAALIALYDINGLGEIEYFEKALSDSDEYVQIAAAYYLGKLHDGNSVDKMIAMMNERTITPILKETIITSLAQIEKLNPVILYPLLKDPLPSIRKTAIIALMNMNVNIPKEYIKDLLKDKFAMIREAAVQSFGNYLGDLLPDEIFNAFQNEKDNIVKSAYFSIFINHNFEQSSKIIDDIVDNGNITAKIGFIKSLSNT